MRIINPVSAASLVVTGTILTLGAAVVGYRIGIGYLPAGMPALVIFLIVVLHRPLRRWRVARRGLGPSDRAWLTQFVPLYGRLDEAGRVRFERDVAWLLDEWTYEPVGEVSITRELLLAVSASGALLLHGRPGWELPRRHTVLFYPDRFNIDYQRDYDASFDGMAHQQGPVILTAPSVYESWQIAGNGEHVVLHELAHLLDFETARADGAPSLLSRSSRAAWLQLVAQEQRRIRSGRSLLRRYALKNNAEFFAVAVENFFDRPNVLEKRHPELYAALKELFDLDLAAAVLASSPTEDPATM